MMASKNRCNKDQNSNKTPFMYAFYKHHSCHIVIEPMSSFCLISKRFQILTDIEAKPIQSAQNVKYENHAFEGEAIFTLCYRGFDLKISAYIIETNSWDVLLNRSVCDEHGISVCNESSQILLKNTSFFFGHQQSADEKDKFVKEPLILKISSNRLVLPGDFLEIKSDDLSSYEGEISIEPMTDTKVSNNSDTWPGPFMTRIIENTIRIPNISPYPIQVNENQSFAKIRRVIGSEQELIMDSNKKWSNQETVKCAKKNISPLLSIVIDPDNILTDVEKIKIATVNKHFKNVFVDNSTTSRRCWKRVKTDINFVSSKPHHLRRKVPLYNEEDLRLFHGEAERLENLGIFAKPESIGVKVRHLSPSFLIKQRSGEIGLETSFDEMHPFVVKSTSTWKSNAEALKELSSWNYVIKLDLNQFLSQIRVKSTSIPYLGTIIPSKGIRVYVKTVKGMPGSTESLQKFISDVFGRTLNEKFIVTIAHSMFICGKEVNDLIKNWCRVLKRFQRKKLKVSPYAVTICPKYASVLGWIWHGSALTINPVNIAPLLTLNPPTTLQDMHLFIDSFKSLSKCIRMCSAIISPIEEIIRDIKDSTCIPLTTELKEHFQRAKEALKSPLTLRIPRTTDQLSITIDIIPKHRVAGITLLSGIGAGKQVAEYFSFKLRSYHLNWQPCEVEAFAIASGIIHFSTYIKNSEHPLLVETNNISCVQAYLNFKRGMFAANSRVSSFLSAISTFQVEVTYSGKSSASTDSFSWEERKHCIRDNCYICRFAAECITPLRDEPVTPRLNSDTFYKSFLDPIAWRFTQLECLKLRRTYVHLIQGTRPSQNARYYEDLQHYIQSAEVNAHGLLVVKDDKEEKDLIVVPAFALAGLLTALHLRSNHLNGIELSAVFSKYFYSLNKDAVINEIIRKCYECKSRSALQIEENSLASFERIREEDSTNDINTASYENTLLLKGSKLIETGVEEDEEERQVTDEFEEVQEDEQAIGVKKEEEESILVGVTGEETQLLLEIDDEENGEWREERSKLEVVNKQERLNDKPYLTRRCGISIVDFDKDEVALDDDISARSNAISSTNDTKGNRVKKEKEEGQDDNEEEEGGEGPSNTHYNEDEKEVNKLEASPNFFQTSDSMMPLIYESEIHEGIEVEKDEDGDQCYRKDEENSIEKTKEGYLYLGLFEDVENIDKVQEIKIENDVEEDENNVQEERDKDISPAGNLAIEYDLNNTYLDSETKENSFRNSCNDEESNLLYTDHEIISALSKEVGNSESFHNSDKALSKIFENEESMFNEVKRENIMDSDGMKLLIENAENNIIKSISSSNERQICAKTKSELPNRKIGVFLSSGFSTTVVQPKRSSESPEDAIQKSLAEETFYEFKFQITKKTKTILPSANLFTDEIIREISRTYEEYNKMSMYCLLESKPYPVVTNRQFCEKMTLTVDEEDNSSTVKEIEMSESQPLLSIERSFRNLSSDLHKQMNNSLNPDSQQLIRKKEDSLWEINDGEMFKTVENDESFDISDDCQQVEDENKKGFESESDDDLFESNPYSSLQAPFTNFQPSSRKSFHKRRLAYWIHI